MKARWSIRSQLMVLGILPAVCTAVLLAGLFNYLRARDAELVLQERGHAIALRLARTSELGVFSGDDDSLQRGAEAELRDRDVLAVRIRDRNGHERVWRREDQERVAVSHAFPLDPASMVFDAPIVQRQITLDDFPSERSDGAGSAAADAKLIGEVAVELSGASTLRRQQRQLLVGTLLAAGCLLLAASLALVLAARLIRPIRSMASSVDQLAEGRLDERIDLPANRELAVLARGINRMADQVQTVQRGLEARIAEATRELTAQKQAAETANAAKGRFLSAASHNVRQPMHALGLFVDALKGRAQDGESRHLLECVEACAGSMNGLLNAVLDLSRLEAGVLRPDIRAFALDPILFQVHLALSGHALEKGLSLRVVPCRLWVQGDASIVETILMNFVSNAIRYTRRGGIVIGCRRRGGQARIEVWDTGIGIQPEDQARVFDEFYQVAGVQRDPDRGLGLGLAVVRGLADLLGARLELHSRPGRGSVFSLSLPRAVPVADQGAPADPPDGLVHGLEGLGVIVVDDDPRILEAMQVLLADWGCRVLVAGSADEARTRVADAGTPVQVIVSDYRLPGTEDGVAVVASLRALLGRAVPAVLLTGDTEATVLKAVEASGLPLLHKPIEPARLRALLNHARARGA
jgi:two-component system, sensor histidine kinase